jgi:uncharacterized protein YgiM (DUF1202 family)
MAPAVPHRLFDRLTALFVVLLLTVPLTVLEVVHPSAATLRHDVQMLADHLPHTATSPVTKPATAPAKPATVAPKAIIASPTAAVITATTNTFVHLRAGESVSSQIITDLNAGTTVELRNDADAVWQGVIYQGKNGYIYRAYLQYQPAPATP